MDAPALDQNTPEKRRQRRLEAQDDAEADNTDPSDEMYAYRHEEETEEDSDQRRQIAQLNAAFKTIQIVGQIARSFAGSLKGDQERELADACFSLGLRLMRFGFDLFKMTKDDFGMVLQRRLRMRDPDLSDEESRSRANAIVFLLVEMCTYAVIRHVAESIGVESLAMTFKEIRDTKQSIAVRTIDTAIQLEHFANIPENGVIELFRDVKDIVLMRSLIQHLTWDRLYYFHCPRDVQQRICSKLGIKPSVETLNPDTKRG